MIIWIMGLSGSGKTTVGKILKKKLKQNHNIIHLDGDSIRKIYNDKLGHTIQEREINAERISKLTKFLSKQKVFLIVSVLSNFPKWLEWNRKNLKNYCEIYIKTNLNILKKRRKKLYSGNIKNVIGVDLKFNEPKKPNFKIVNDNSLTTLNKKIDQIINKLKLNN